MKPYPKYKDSGIEWIGEIPEGWVLKKVKFLSKGHPQYGLNIASEHYAAEGVRFLRTTDIDDHGQLWPEGVYLEAKDVATEYLLQVNDFLISRSGTIGRAYIHRDHRRKYSYAGYLVRFRFESPSVADFMFYVTKSDGFAKWLSENSIESTIGNVNGQKYANFSLALPETGSQITVIATYLDRKSKQIDGLIEKKQNQIELLREQRTAVINEAVTKGLNPKAKMTDSGVDLIGMIPEHWEIKKFKRCVSIASGQVNPDEEPYKSMNLIAPNHIESGTGRILSSETSADQGAESGKYLFKKHDVLYSKIRPHLQKACIADHEGLCSADMYPLEPSNNLISRYLLYLILSDGFTRFAVERSMRIAMPKINREDLNEYMLVCPPLPEQQAIAAYLDHKTSEFDALITKEERLIELLQEYRTSLISEVVTGKVDVRSEN